MKIKELVTNAIVAALYVVVTLIFPSFTALQMRASEIFAHLPVFNKKYTTGLLLGVAIANIWSPFGIFDIFFGTLHSAVSVYLMFILTKKMTSVVKKMVVNTIIFSVTSFILAGMTYFIDPTAGAFWPMYISFFLSIAIVMAIGVPVMKFLDSRLDFNRQVDEK